MKREANNYTECNLSDFENFSIVRNFIVEKGFSTENFDTNLKSLIIVNDKTQSSYDAKKNKIITNIQSVDFIHELFHMASNKLNEKSNHGARGENGFGISLDEGITDYLTSYVDSQYETNYKFETLLVDCINQMYSNLSNILLKFYFTSNQAAFYGMFKKDKPIIYDIIKNLDFYTRYIINCRNVLNCSDDKVRDEMLKENARNKYIAYNCLTNAFSILINHCALTNIDLAGYFYEDFISTVEDVYGDLYKNEMDYIIKDFKSKINVKGLELEWK